jgi:WD40 repeat protein
MNNLYGDDTDLLVSASSDHSIRIWDLQKRRCIKVLESTED